MKIEAIIISGFVLLSAACQNVGTQNSTKGKFVTNTYSDTLSYPVIEFESTSYDFGRVYEGETVGWFFTYKNNGTTNLILHEVKASCGCTVPEYSKEPIAPGKQGKIKVLFDTSGRNGHQEKTIKVESNGKPAAIDLYISAEIVKK
jgi:hypothetical protein